MMDINSDQIKSQLVTMLDYQKALNDVFDPQWRQNRHQYLRAAIVEGGEMIDHHGYKWWKAHSKNLPQMQLELIDIIHFYLSEIARIHGDGDVDALLKGWCVEEAEIIFDSKTFVIEDLSLLDKIELLIGLAVSRRISWSLYRAIMKDSELSFAQLYRQYAGKNVLNLFRQRHGDKQGTYIKLWDGVEDNVYLAELMAEWQDHETMDELYARLSDKYQKYAIKA